MQAACVTLAGVTLVGCSDSSRFGEGPAYSPGTANQQAILGGTPMRGGPETTGSIQPRPDPEPWYGRPWQSPRATPPNYQPAPQQSYNTGIQAPPYQQPQYASPTYSPRPTYQMQSGPAPVNAQPLQPLAQAPRVQAPAPVNMPRVAAVPPAIQPMPAPMATQQRVPAAAPVTTGSASFRPTAPAAPQAMPAPVVNQHQDAAHQLASNWTGQGGTYVTLKDGETIGGLAQRYGVPVSAIMSVNNFADATRVHPGQSVLIPTFNASRATEAARPTAPVAVAQPPQTQSQTLQLAGSHIVKHGESVDSIAKLYGVPADKLRLANNWHGNVVLKPNTRVMIPAVPGRHVAEAQPAATGSQPLATVASIAPQHSGTPVAPAQGPVKVVEQKPQPAPAATSSNVLALAAEPKPSADNPRATEAPSKQLAFRWPVRGRIIEEFGANAGGARNDGINLAVPEGTSVKAAEDGEVIYSGNELKGYGNVVLVKHPDGFVSVYAHASDLLVNKGDKVSRGQIIARAGATGNVSQPQLHFELRKGQHPIDPKSYLTN
jgi:murein DD-endopeptidase MepM/ murein hydrolase activator NlpD